MFDKFGEFDSVEELNLTAAGLLKEGDIKNLHVLAKENGIEEEDVKDYVAGEIDELTDVIGAAIGKLKIEKTKANPYEAIIADYLMANSGEIKLAKAIRKKGKSVKKALAAMTEKAKKIKVGNMAILTDKQGYAIVREYYLKEGEKVEKAK
jgi:hypothetical protein